jgi:DnaJ-class molecular chaperone
MLHNEKGTIQCADCGGSGTRQVEFGLITQDMPCRTCNGTGRVKPPKGRQACPYCADGEPDKNCSLCGGVRHLPVEFCLRCKNSGVYVERVPGRFDPMLCDDSGGGYDVTRFCVCPRGQERRKDEARLEMAEDERRRIAGEISKKYT